MRAVRPAVQGNDIERLIELLSKLPGLGPRSARRAALYLLKRRDSLLLPLASALGEAAANTHGCSVCGNLDTADPCHICRDEKRDRSLICVVEEVADLWAMERAGVYRGLYHVLGGVLSALDGVGPDDLAIRGLLERVASPVVGEVVLATNATVDGQTTAHYLADRLAETPRAGPRLKVTRLAHGLPMGGELDYLDDGTLETALRSRREA